MWDLYIFPGGKVGERKTKMGARTWMWLNAWRVAALRAINRATNEHMVR